MTPLLVTLFGDDVNMGFWQVIVSLAVTNIISDIQGVENKSESWKTAVLNTLFPYIGEYAGDQLWKTTPAAQTKLTGVAGLPAKAQQALGAAITAVPLIGATVYQMVKGYAI